MSRATTFSIVVLCWAAIYLPGLGSLEIKGEEGRRILPAVTMIESGNYLVPQVGSEPYYRKPPLVNWLVAASFKLFGHRNEWTARLPSVLSVLAVAVAFVLVARTSLGANGSLIGALIWLANFGMIEKGRLIEIEALYVSLFGLAMICWLSWWQQRRSPWLTWTVPWVFLGLGLLAKGPLHLFFFYAVVLAVLVGAGELRKLWHVAHLVGFLIMLGIFAAWAVPYWQEMRGSNLAETWSAQLTGRLTGDDFKLGNWLLNIPRGLAYFLPWTLLLPLARGAWRPTSRETNLLRALTWGCAISFVIVNLLPGALPRYSMPLLVPASWIMAMTLSAEEIRARGSWKSLGLLPPARRLRLVVITAIAACIALAMYASAVIPYLQKRSKVKPIAAQIDALVPKSEPLYAIDPDYQPFLFYMRSRLVYASGVEEVPVNARYLLVRSTNELKVVRSEHWAPRHPRSIFSATDYRQQTVVLLKVD
ncbi:MAG: glycosyltransferase family 39 protein, partial [Verrucomicrobiota bacterium]|nr:glycosyltransferase family 39 protein [Verrucomicrobiota bacterium]